MQRSVFHLQIDFNNLFAVIPATAGIGHEDCLIKTEEGDTDQITDKEVGVKECQRQTHKEDHDEDVDHTLLSILGTNLNDFLGVFNRCFFFIQIDILLNKHNGLIGTGGNCLYGSARKPVNDCAAHQQAQNDLRLNQRKFRDNISEETFQHDDDTENHGGGADNGGSDQHGFGCRFKGIPRTIGRFQKVLGQFKIRCNSVFFFHNVFCVGT